jgi:hypothetical protein
MATNDEITAAQLAAIASEERRKDAAEQRKQATEEAAERRAQEEHEARLAQLRGAAGAVSLAPTGEKLPDTVVHVAQRIPGLDPRLVKQILDSTFDPLNLCRLCYLGPKEPAWTEDLVGGQRVLTEKKPTPSSFGTDSTIFTQGFVVYQRIVHELFGATHPEMGIALVCFLGQVLDASERFGWQEAVLPMALYHMGRVTSFGTLVAANWVIHADLSHQFCTADRSRTAIVAQAKWTSLAKSGSKVPTPSASPGSSESGKKKFACNKFNNGTCEKGSSCTYDHRCKICDSASHGSLHHQ